MVSKRRCRMTNCSRSARGKPLGAFHGSTSFRSKKTTSLERRRGLSAAGKIRLHRSNLKALSDKIGLTSAYLLIATKSRTSHHVGDGPLAEAGTTLKALDYSDEGCQPTFFNVIPDKSNVDAPFKFTARISRTTPLAFSSRTVIARLTNAASESPPL